MTTYLTSEGDTLDEIVWRQYGQQSGAVEMVLEANPGLADLGSVYPAGVQIELPELSQPAETTQQIRLWD